MQHLSFPIPDMGTIELSGYRVIVDAITSESAAGRPVFVRCWGGVGRTGTVVGCLLADEGSEDTDIIERINHLRSGTRKSHRLCPESPSQMNLLKSWHLPPAAAGPR